VGALGEGGVREARRLVGGVKRADGRAEGEKIITTYKFLETSELLERKFALQESPVEGGKRGDEKAGRTVSINRRRGHHAGRGFGERRTLLSPGIGKGGRLVSRLGKKKRGGGRSWYWFKRIRAHGQRKLFFRGKVV